MSNYRVGSVSGGESIDYHLADWNEIESGFIDGGILIGNGFSQAVWRKFGYSSIYRASSSRDYTDHPLTLEDCRLFDLMGTTNFEMVLSRLAGAKEVNLACRKKYDYIEERYQHIKTALGEAVRAVHVPWHRMTEEVLSKIRFELKRYKFIYSTNYDLIPYWAIMSQKTANGFKDYFWGKDLEDLVNGDSFFDIADSSIRNNPTRIFYLHGALHIYRDDSTGLTHKFKNRGPESLLNLSKIPLFITEGSSKDKLKAIRNSDYLLFAYNQFLNHSGSLLVFGHSLSGEDNHLVSAIKEGIINRRINRIAISVRASNSREKIMKKKIDIYTSLCSGLNPATLPELFFFDSKTHLLGSECIRIEENDEIDLF